MTWWFWILVVAGLAFLVVFAVRVAPCRSPEAFAEGSLEIAKRRYARGEISREQYHELKRDLEGLP